ncbi:Prolipoprotein diacylglyceryl transferase [Emticicia oligotrophica DSM 17448]|uniref:Phosphatidylglycerol--prolipoprotein diacylglyceryl transferase n=1 Tax=Emticicia oligotrophica (strain DSM 17448 / CIP 109782 / MTCC 6937 / GPTSA100-15) TaxID=929562 RepID=A0ABN4AKT9_EMTOG|nr:MULTISPECIES: prolipoprotein diacylglyceryl transferase [Emticicia]AFK02967.1 Prolipoprotein diacylglyceryl transferase [Emticicia oligotrophica DSM 17448]
MTLLEIPWNVNPIIAKLGSFELRWYGLLFASGFLLGYQIMLNVFRKEHKSEKDLDTLLFVMIIATVIGARFGHYFFYEFDSFLKNPGEFLIDMITPPYQGLASHGALVGIITALVIYARSHKDQPFLWVADRIVITVALAGFFIRMGNLMNHEIVGKATNVPWAFRFNAFSQTPTGDLIMTPEPFARHPAQLYEALSCLILFVILYSIWNKFKEKTPRGLLLGIFLIWVFGLRFCYEFLKENQEAFEDKMALNMGQILSIPAVLLGIGVLIYTFKNKQNQEAA